MIRVSSKEFFKFRANQWINFNAPYSLNDLIDNKNYGRLVRKDIHSIWKVSLGSIRIAKIIKDNA